MTIKAKWVAKTVYKNYATNGITKAIIGCSNCEALSPTNQPYPYCPYCGAKMTNVQDDKWAWVDDKDAQIVPDFGEPRRENELYSDKPLGFSLSSNSVSSNSSNSNRYNLII